MMANQHPGRDDAIDERPDEAVYPPIEAFKSDFAIPVILLVTLPFPTVVGTLDIYSVPDVRNCVHSTHVELLSQFPIRKIDVHKGPILRRKGTNCPSGLPSAINLSFSSRRKK